MTASTFIALLDVLGVRRSHSRPRVSNDNAHAEATFRTVKYRSTYPVNGFDTIDDAREWMLGFVRWYNDKHRHRGIGFVTPNQRHAGLDIEIMAQRKRVYEQARARHPERWSGETRDWTPAGPVWLNPATNTRDLEGAA